MNREIERIALSTIYNPERIDILLEIAEHTTNPTHAIKLLLGISDDETWDVKTTDNVKGLHISSDARLEAIAGGRNRTAYEPKVDDKTEQEVDVLSIPRRRLIANANGVMKAIFIEYSAITNEVTFRYVENCKSTYNRGKCSYRNWVNSVGW